MFQLKIARAKVEMHKRLCTEHDAAIVIQQWWRRTMRMRNCKDGYQEYLDSARIIQRWWRRKRALIRRDNEFFDSEQVDERFKTMKLMSPVADPIDLNCAFLELDTLVVSTRAPRRRRQSPEQKWIVPEQTVELKPVGISLPASTPIKPRPPSNGSTQPYQVQLVRKETLRSQLQATQNRAKSSWTEMEQMEIIPTPDLNFSGDVSENANSPPAPQSKKSSRRHKREQESMMMNAQLPPKDPNSKEEAPKMRNTRRPRSRSHNRRQSEADLPVMMFEKKVRPRERPPSAILPRDKIHERIELRPDGSRTTSSFVSTPRSYEPGKSQFRPSPQPLERRDSIRERREVPPPAKIIQRRAPVERHQSVKEKALEDSRDLDIDVLRQVPHSTRLLRKSNNKASEYSRNRSNSLDAQERETTTSADRKAAKSDWQADIPDWENNDKTSHVVDGKLAPLNMPRHMLPKVADIKEPVYQPAPIVIPEVPSKRSSNIVHVFKNRLKRKRNKQKESQTQANLSVIRKEVIPKMIVLDEGDPEGPENLIAFLDERLKLFSKDDSGNDEINDIWRNALNEFKDTLRSLSVQGYNELLLDQLLENFSEAFQSQIDRSCGGDEEKKKLLPYQMYMNSFRGTLEDFVKESKSSRPLRRPRPKKIEKDDCRGHHFSRHQVIQPNVCAVCQQRLFFMIDKVQICSICKILVHKDCIKNPKLPQCSLTSQDIKLFGVPLQCLCRDGQDTPEFVIKVLSYLELNGILKQGLYRVSGAKVEEKKLESELEQDPYCFKKVQFENYNVHCVASIFKIFLRRLPDPLVPFEYYDNVLRAMTLPEKECQDELLSIFNGLPRHHKGTLERVVFHLARVAQKQEDNKMNPQNLAIIIAPCIIRAPDHIPPLTVAQQIGPTTRAVEIIIKNQLEVLKTKFNSFSALDAKERQLQRGLKEVRRSKMKHSIRVSRHQSKPVTQEPEESIDHDEKRLAADLARIKQQKRATFSSIRAFSQPADEPEAFRFPPTAFTQRAASNPPARTPSTPKAEQFIRADKNRLAHRRFNKSSKFTNL